MGLQTALGLGAFLLASAANAHTVDTPLCMAWGQPLGLNNAQVLHWKRVTPNLFRDRAHIRGRIVMLYPERNGHAHFKAQIGSRPEDTLEIVYNHDFGDLPDLQPGMLIEVCGDYITSNESNGKYPASPDRAILHWVHWSPREDWHDSGFVMIGDRFYGFDKERIANNPKQKEYMARNIYPPSDDAYDMSARHAASGFYEY